MTVSATSPRRAGSAHAVADHLAAAELHFLAVDRVVALDFDDELGVTEDARGRRWWGHTSRRRHDGRFGSWKPAHDFRGESVHDAIAAESHEFDFALLARLEAHGGTRGDIEAKSFRCRAFESQRLVRFEKVVVRADLDGVYRPCWRPSP
jgi:hypothetical protein